jgi:pyruvate,water dikinase
VVEQAAVRFVLPLAEADRARGGGKAGALAELLAAGFDVPPGFVVTTDALDSSGRMGPEVRDDVTTAYEALGSPTVAVRSSATAEDLEGASFAGIYDTVLDVDGVDALVDAVERVWASLRGPRAVAYRRDRGMAEDALGMAVVVQAMVPADIAGVLFTRHPLTGAEDVIVASAARGAGEGVVDGTAPVETVEIDAATGTLRRTETAVDGGPLLDAGRLAELARVGRAVHDALGHRDVEFAVVDGAVRLLQARPITALDAAPDTAAFQPAWGDPADASRSWMLRSRSPMTRLEEDVVASLTESMRRGYEETALPFTAMHLGITVHGYRYAAAPEPDPSHVERATARLEARRRELRRAGTSLYEADVEPLLLERLAELRRLARRRTLPALLLRLDRAIDAYCLAMGDLHWRIQVAPVDWPPEYERLTGRPAAEAQTLLQALTNRTTRLIASLRRLAGVVQSDPVLRAVFAERRWERLDDAEVAARPATSQFRGGFGRLLRDHGLRTGMGMGGVADYRTPTWRMDPAVPLGMIATYAAHDLDAVVARERSLRRARRRLERQLERDFAAHPEHREEFEELHRHLVNASRTTEDHNHLMEQALGGNMREAVDAVGRALVDRGLLDVPDDVFHLSVGELRVIASDPAALDVRAVVAVRSREHGRRATLRPPRSLGAPAAGRPPGGGPAPAEGTGLDGTVLRGVAAARGRVTGPARVVGPSHEPPEVRPGDILVATIAGEAWTPIWPLLGGLVLDQGGIFQHAAVVAREYGVPTVVATREATTSITDGQLVTVDGDLGVVELG